MSNTPKVAAMEVFPVAGKDCMELNLSGAHAPYFTRNVVVLTQPEGFRKHQTKTLPLFRLLMKRYPCITEAMARRHVMYNGQLDYLHSQEEQGNALVIYPHDTLPIGRVQQDKKRMERVYRMGREAATEALPRLKEFMRKDQGDE